MAQTERSKRSKHYVGGEQGMNIQTSDEETKKWRQWAARLYGEGLIEKPTLTAFTRYSIESTIERHETKAQEDK